MRRASRFWSLAAAILVVASAQIMPAAAKMSASKHFYANTGTGAMYFRLKIKNLGKGGDLSDVSTTPLRPVGMTGGESAGALGFASAKALCYAAVDEQYVCSALFYSCTPGLGNYSCCDVPDNNSMYVTCVQALTTGSQSGFTISRSASPNDTYFEVYATGATTDIQALDHTTTAGNRVDTDLHSKFCLRIDRGSTPTDGTVNIYVDHFNGIGPPAVSHISVDTTGKSDTQIHQELADDLNGLGLGLELGVTDDAQVCDFPETFNGPLVSIWNFPRGGVFNFGVQGVEGQMVIAESNGVALEGSIPTLSEWGLLLLVLLLGASAVWMLRHRRKLGGEA